jgi:hypothetical protein
LGKTKALKNTAMLINTVKASNFGLQVNFGPFSERLAVIKTRPTEKYRK